MQRLRDGILAGRALRERQCALKGEAQYVNEQDSVQWARMYRVGEYTLEVQIFFINYAGLHLKKTSADRTNSMYST